ncbi:response regulator [Magnetospirillum gryphiswaldense]|uniref:Two-component response regulator n=1 Tax=Magnetospirillum gryphiswaldense TaxID=55518 RepID=A4TY71_9PROT|nr:response regulator [Magnetospirillum gryphiswaldense]AVM73520.1 Response regulator rcp1 [Magnetospirillum gryphiswaldense MSR-1]AVM77423.1 Response regulator rcp1 [Magnetospirillum gryphiswaldense]CAM75578.1 two-component response regulator [Magnetospirillum gryphiswaldense MSR-1]
MPHSQTFDILLVEDDPGDAGLTKAALAQARILCKLHHVSDGVEAMAFLRRQGIHADAPTPHLVLLDLNMPRMSGREVLAAMRGDEALHKIPVVVLTTSDVEADIETSYELGANSFITKPVDIDQFIDSIKAVGDYWFSIVRLPQ